MGGRLGETHESMVNGASVHFFTRIVAFPYRGNG